MVWVANLRQEGGTIVVSLYLLDFGSGKGYVGITTKLPQKRLSQHVATASAGSGLLVHRAIRKYGTPILTVLATGTIEQMAELEVAMIDGLDTLVPRGYNLDKGGSVRNMSDDERAACSERWNDPSYRAKIEPNLRGPEARRKAAEACRGRKRTPEQRARMSAGMTGVKKRPLSAERRAQISEQMKHVWAERRAKVDSA